MKIEKDMVASLEYTLKLDTGDIVDSSEGGDPLHYLHGHGQIVPGLEKALEGRAAGESFDVRIPPSDAYGDRQDGRELVIPRTRLPRGLVLEVGAAIAARDEHGHEVPYWVSAVRGTEIVLDGNHPLAGKALNFEVRVQDVRKATDEELSHGHVHGPGAHHAH